MKRPGIKSILISSVVLLSVAGVAYYYTQWHAKLVTTTYNPQTKVSQSTSSDHQVGGITDNNTPQPTVAVTTSTSPPPGSKAVVPSGIAISSPTINQLLGNGSVISGSSALGSVNYRIIDTSAGVLATGQLNVSTDQKFSGTIQNLKPYAKTGYIEFFNTAASGVESNNIKVAVTF